MKKINNHWFYETIVRVRRAMLTSCNYWFNLELLETKKREVKLPKSTKIEVVSKKLLSLFLRPRNL